ncbi:10781_t:CDS:2 [Paraglomus brasilianum]|uniref:10781_t:CDS:1 n=1 Tax=Paraglomus brasilianum TaxID=144538 RepID=A0A9N8ZPT3_9GLOM|nr:10781_t:CDS:2 [Paraglomus brasilianum]
MSEYQLLVPQQVYASIIWPSINLRLNKCSLDHSSAALILFNKDIKLSYYSSQLILLVLMPMYQFMSGYNYATESSDSAPIGELREKTKIPMEEAQRNIAVETEASDASSSHHYERQNIDHLSKKNTTYIRFVLSVYRLSP